MAAFFLPAIAAFALISALPTHARSPTYVLSQEALNATVAKLNAHIKQVTSAPDFREGGTPLVFLHPAGTRVFGTVLVFHGFSQNAFANRIQAKFLFDQKFNVVSFNLAGFANVPSSWPSMVVRESAGYSKLRKIFLEDPSIGEFLAGLQTFNSTPEAATFIASRNARYIPRMLSVLKKALPPAEFVQAERLIESLTPGRAVPGVEKYLNKFFLSDHGRFESDPFFKLHLLQALPGPIHTVGYSLGTTAVVNLAAQSKVIAKSVILAPYFGHPANQTLADFTHSTLVFGSLDLVTFPLRSLRVPGRIWTGSLGPPASLLNRDSVLNSMRESTQTLCIIAEDDMAVDVEASLRVCRSKLGGRAVVYPKSLGLDHFITPEVGSKYSNAMLKEISRFFISGEVDDRAFLVPN